MSQCLNVSLLLIIIMTILSNYILINRNEINFKECLSRVELEKEEEEVEIQRE